MPSSRLLKNRFYAAESYLADLSAPRRGVQGRASPCQCNFQFFSLLRITNKQPHTALKQVIAIALDSFPRYGQTMICLNLSQSNMRWVGVACKGISRIGKSFLFRLPPRHCKGMLA
jgi:hypothetical protein